MTGLTILHNNIQNTTLQKCSRYVGIIVFVLDNIYLFFVSFQAILVLVLAILATALAHPQIHGGFSHGGVHAHGPHGHHGIDIGHTSGHLGVQRPGHHHGYGHGHGGIRAGHGHIRIH